MTVFEWVAQLWRRNVQLERGDLQVIINYSLLSKGVKSAYLLRDDEVIDCVHGAMSTEKVKEWCMIDR